MAQFEFLSNSQPTVGMDFAMKTIYNGDQIIKFCFWDTAGQEKFKSLIPSYLKDAAMAILVYDITSKQKSSLESNSRLQLLNLLDRESFESVDTWMDFLKNKSHDNIKIALVGNKLDKEDKRQVSLMDGTEKARDADGLFMEVSAKSGAHVFELFRTVTSSLADIQDGALAHPETDIQLNQAGQKSSTGTGAQATKKKKRCC